MTPSPHPAQSQKGMHSVDIPSPSLVERGLLCYQRERWSSGTEHKGRGMWYCPYHWPSPKKEVMGWSCPQPVLVETNSAYPSKTQIQRIMLEEIARHIRLSPPRHQKPQTHRNMLEGFLLKKVLPSETNPKTFQIYMSNEFML